MDRPGRRALAAREGHGHRHTAHGHILRHLPMGRVFVCSMEPPFKAPELHETMYWNDLADTDPAHAWLRQMIMDVASDISEPCLAGASGSEHRLISAV